jgi:hypothetical protein
LLFMSLNFVFNYELNYFDQIINITYTFLLFFLFANLFDFLEKSILGNRHAG